MGKAATTEISRKFYGATYHLDVLGKGLGLVSRLKQCFPHSDRQINSLDYYLILEADKPMSRSSKWSALHQHFYGAIRNQSITQYHGRRITSKSF